LWRQVTFTIVLFRYPVQSKLGCGRRTMLEIFLLLLLGGLALLVSVLIAIHILKE
jgi:hypothetical protein